MKIRFFRHVKTWFFFARIIRLTYLTTSQYIWGLFYETQCHHGKKQCINNLLKGDSWIQWPKESYIYKYTPSACVS